MNTPAPKSSLTLAIAKGRILDEALALLAKIDIFPSEDIKHSRKLCLPTNRPDLSLLIVRPADVATYVQYGAAELGIVGKDSLIEHGYAGLGELLDLQIARCRLMSAKMVGHDLSQKTTLTVASKYVVSSKRFYAEKGIHASVIKLYGSMEIAPLVGLADCIVDLVDTGNTLKANGLEADELVLEISSRLIASRMAMKTQSQAIKQFVEQFKQVLS